jgi:hypothetical protein
MKRLPIGENTASAVIVAEIIQPEIATWIFVFRDLETSKNREKTEKNATLSIFYRMLNLRYLLNLR